jgi:type II secretory pathway pseudopilin PulG
MSRARGQRGFTIVEVMVAATVLMVGVLGTLAMLDTAIKKTKTAGNRQAGVELVRDLAEAVRQISYRDVQNDTIVGLLQENENLRGTGDSDWHVERGNVSFTLGATVCAVDDPADGTGSHSGGGFCAGGKPAGSTDANAADYKMVTVSASWSEGAGTKEVKESVLVASGGRDRPGMETLILTSPTSEIITSPAITRATFRATTTVTADAVLWAVDGVEWGSATGDGRTWNFAWTLPNIDGAYEVQAQASDASGISGAPRSITVTINRYPPAVPEDFNAGRNGTVVEAEWSANPERDVIGYRVYKQATGGPVEVACPFTEDSSCIDPAPGPETQSLLYWVVAIDRDQAAAEREGEASAKINVNSSPGQPPAPPTDLEIGLDEDGAVVVSWTQSDDAETYRIYRDGVTVADRYARPEFDDFEFTDPDADPEEESHQYWITAVDDRLRESVLVGPVSL